jgi:phosphate starvation-inducible PhoH-like protein
VFGSYDENLKHLETLFNVRTRTSGHEVIVEGDVADVVRAERVLEQLAGLLRGGYKLAKGDVRTAAQLVSQDEQVELADYFLRGAARSSGKRQVIAKSVNQRKYLDAIDKHDVVFGIGPAGTGKTYLAMAQAVTYLLSKRVSRVVLARPAVEAGEKLGFLPGDLQEKVNPYLRPLYDALYDMIDLERVERLVERGTIEVAPIAFMRGRTLNDAFVILDEAQNTTSEQMKMFLTRLGFGSKAVVTGDITQIDLPSGRPSGLVEAMKVVGGIDGISFVHFDERDVVRHQLVQQIVKAYESYGGSRQYTPARLGERRRRPCRSRRRPGPLARCDRAATCGRRGQHRARERCPHARAQPEVSSSRLSDRRPLILRRWGSDRLCQQFSALAGPHPRSLSRGDFAPRSGRRRSWRVCRRRHRHSDRSRTASGDRGRPFVSGRAAGARAARAAAPPRVRPSRSPRPRPDGAR